MENPFKMTDFFSQLEHLYETIVKFTQLCSKFLPTALLNCACEYNNNNSNNDKIWILFAMSAYSFDELKFTSTREKRKEKENNKQKHQKFAIPNLPEP